MKSCLQEIPLPRVLRVKELQQIEDKRLVDISLGEVGIEIRAFHESQEELVNDLEVRPGKLKYRFIFLRVVRITCWVNGWGYRAEEVAGKLSNTKDKKGTETK